MYAEFALIAALASLVGTLPQGHAGITSEEDARNATTSLSHRTSFSTSIYTDVSMHLSMDDTIIRARSDNPPKTLGTAQHPKSHLESRPVIHHTSRSGENEPGEKTRSHTSESRPVIKDISRNNGNNPGEKTAPFASVRHSAGTGHPLPHTPQPFANEPHQKTEAHISIPRKASTEGHKHSPRASPDNAFSVLSSALSSQRHHPHPSDPVRSFRHSQEHHTPKPKVTGSKITPIGSKHKVTGTKIHPVPSDQPKSPKSDGHPSSHTPKLPKFERKHPPSPITALPKDSPKVTGDKITPIVTPNPKSKANTSHISGLNNPFMHPNRPVTNSKQLPTPKHTGTGKVGHAKQVKTTSTHTQGNGGGFIGKKCTWTPKAKCSAGF